MTQGKTEQLQRLRARIAEIQSEVLSAQTRVDSLHAELRDTALAIAKAIKARRRLDRHIDALDESLRDTVARKRTKLKELQAARDTVREQIYLAYVFGRHDFIKLLLNQEDPSRVSRLMTYHDYIMRAHTRRMAGMRKTLSELDTLEKKITRDSTELIQLRRRQREELAELERHRQWRNEVITKLQGRLANKKGRLQALRADAAKLDQLIRSLGTAVATTMPHTVSDKPFTDKPFKVLKGKLPWPVAGPIVRRFGSSRGNSSLKWEGVVIGADAETDIRAVSKGRVVFADWFRNLGMLIILDHGNGYMTLYGHNQALFRSAGDWVKAGETIASSGDIGGGVYFEVRHHGVPVDPANWCRG